ncbi:MAG: hypothetical protein ABJO09_00825 [Hyphomicrobiales bacterium]
MQPRNDYDLEERSAKVGRPVARVAISIRTAPEIRYELIVYNNGSNLSV